MEDDLRVTLHEVENADHPAQIGQMWMQCMMEDDTRMTQREISTMNVAASETTASAVKITMAITAVEITAGVEIMAIAEIVVKEP